MPFPLKLPAEKEFPLPARPYLNPGPILIMTRYIHYAIKGPRTQALKRPPNVTEGTLPGVLPAIPQTHFLHFVLLMLLLLLDPYLANTTHYFLTAHTASDSG
jgi:hypothetical protein